MKTRAKSFPYARRARDVRRDGCYRRLQVCIGPYAWDTCNSLQREGLSSVFPVVCLPPDRMAAEFDWSLAGLFDGVDLHCDDTSLQLVTEVAVLCLYGGAREVYCLEIGRYEHRFLCS